HHFEVGHNHLHAPAAFSKEGIDAKHGASFGSIHHNRVENLHRLGIYIDAYGVKTEDIEVHANEVVGCTHGIVVTNEKSTGAASNIRVYNNLTRQAKYFGINLHYSPGYGKVEKLYVYNNTTYNNG